jgi:hypothetical protein
METGQPGFFKRRPESVDGLDDAELAAHMDKTDVFELWRQLSLLAKTYEDVWREWFLPTALGETTSAP